MLYFHANHVKVNREWVLLKPGDMLVHTSFDTHTVDDSLYVGLGHFV